MVKGDMCSLWFGLLLVQTFDRPFVSWNSGTAKAELRPVEQEEQSLDDSILISTHLG